MIPLIVSLLFAQTPIDFADYLYATGDYRRAALEYERIGFLDGQDSVLASYSLLRAGQALLSADEPYRAARIYSRGISNLPHDRPCFTYGLLRAEFAQDHFSAVDTLAPLLEETNLEWDAAIYQSFSLAFLGDTVRAAHRLSTLDKSELRDDAITLIGTPLKHRSPFFSATLSTVLPGAGQAYCGRGGDAWQSFSITGLMAGSAVYYFFFSPDTSTGNTVKGVVTASLAGLFWLSNIYGAVNAALDYNDYAERKREEQLRNLLDRFDLENEIP